jgi:hypothetical protein
VVALAMAAHAAVLGSRVPAEPNIHVPFDLSQSALGIVMPGSIGDRWSPGVGW